MEETTLKPLQQIRDNLSEVFRGIERAAINAGREPKSIKLVVVTKKQPLEAIVAAIEFGVVYLGENYADEAIPKINGLQSYDSIKWHMIGHVQSRKAEMVCHHFDYVHSLDSLKLAMRYDRFANELGRKLPVLLQFNISGEETKSGWDVREESQWPLIFPEIEIIMGLRSIDIKGVMAMPPFSDKPEDARPYYRRLVQLRDLLARQFPQLAWEELSMGMSSDYEIAIQEGATWVRIGQAIFGPRP